MDTCSRPDSFATALHLHQYVIDKSRAEVTRTVTSIRPAGRCLLYCVLARRIRSRNQRRLAHVPRGGDQVPLVTPGMSVVSRASTSVSGGRMVVRRRIRLHVPAARLTASSRWAQGRIGLLAEAVRSEIRLIVGDESSPRRGCRV
jgi:hypothetical protein